MRLALLRHFFGTPAEHLEGTRDRPARPMAQRIASDRKRSGAA
jgi:hypothetical protein